MLSCGHTRPVDGPQYDFSYEDDADLPSRRACKQCPVIHRGLQ